MIPDLEALTAYVEVVERGGFSAAARRLGIATSMVSRRVTRLEAALKVRLLERTTRGLAPTEAGRAFHERARELLAGLQEACEQAAAPVGEVAGTLRLTAPASFMRTLVVPVAAALAQRHERLVLEVELDDGRLDLLREGFDVAVRAGPLADSDLLRRPLCEVEGVVVASPAYLKRRGVPKGAADLARHVGLDHTGLQPSRLWRFESGSAVSFERRLLVNNLDALFELALAGAGVAALPLATAAAAVEAGRLRRLLARERLVPHALTALYPVSRRSSPKVRALLEALATHAAQPQAAWGAAATTVPRKRPAAQGG